MAQTTDNNKSIFNSPIITLGSPYGIGYKIFLLSLYEEPFKDNMSVCIGSKRILEFFQNMIGIEPSYKTVSINELNEKLAKDKQFDFLLVDIDHLYKGKLSQQIDIETISPEIDGWYALKSIEIAADLVLSGIFNSVVTLPVSKNNISLFESDFKGHTEFFQKKWNEKKVFMTFVSESMSLLLLTTHIPLCKVSSAITSEVVKDGIATAIELHKKLSFSKPICFLGLNPHAGENGILGDEELWIKDIIDSFNTHKNVVLEGPIPADTAFISANRARYSIFIALYHDQGLIPFKMLAFEDGVNLSFGMKYIRTSVDHGTGVNLIRESNINIKSFINAYKLALKLSS